jgi:radical SAM protein with 4Fe4S-binding SPASM domain
MTASPGHAKGSPFFVAPAWAGADDGDACEVFNFRNAESVTLTGRARAALLEGRGATDPALGVMSKLEPVLGRFVRDLDARGMVPLDRATLLRGERYKQLYIELTARCNEQCVHCYAESSPHRTEEHTWDKIEQLLHDAVALDFYTVQLTGGDPLVSKHAIPAAKLAKELGVPRVELFTNGLALTGSTYETLRDLGCAFAFSFYSYDPETHDSVTQTPGSQVRTARAIKRAVEDGLEVRAGCIVGPWNKDHGAETIAFLEDLGLSQDRIGVHGMATVGRGEASRWSLPPEWRTTSNRVVPDAFLGNAAVSYDGDVFPCIFSRMFPLGNVYEQGLKEILEAPIPVSFDMSTFKEGQAKWAEELTCWECRLRASCLENDPQDLVPLRTQKAS